MNKIVLIMLLSIKITAPFIQKRQDNVGGLIRKSKKYTIEVVISEDLCNKNNFNEYEDIKNEYFKKVVKINVDTTKFKEEKLTYLSKWYYKKGTIYTYETTDYNHYLDFLKVASNGVEVYPKKESNNELI